MIAAGTQAANRQGDKTHIRKHSPTEGPQAGFPGSLGQPASSSTRTSLKQLRLQQRPVVWLQSLKQHCILYHNASGAEVTGVGGLQTHHDGTLPVSCCDSPSAPTLARGVHGPGHTPPGPRQVPPVHRSGPALTARRPLHECSFPSRPRSKCHIEPANALLGVCPSNSLGTSPPDPAGQNRFCRMDLPLALTTHPP